MAGKGYGFHRDVANSELDILAAGTIALTLSTTAVSFPTGAMVIGGRGTKTQLSNQQTTVVINAPAGIITLFDVALAAGGESQFTVTNSSVAAFDTVICCVGEYNDAGGEGFATVSDVQAGSFKIVLYNPSGADAFEDATTINFVVIKSTA